MTIAQTLRHIPKGLLLALLISTPLIAAQNVRAGSESIIEGHYNRSSGAGLVLMVSLKRSR